MTGEKGMRLVKTGFDIYYDIEDAPTPEHKQRLHTKSWVSLQDLIEFLNREKPTHLGVLYWLENQR